MFPCLFQVSSDITPSKSSDFSKVVHPNIIPTVRETEQDYMTSLVPYEDEVKDAALNALKANLEGVFVMLSPPRRSEKERVGEDDESRDIGAGAKRNGHVGDRARPSKAVTQGGRMSTALAEEEYLLRLFKIEDTLKFIDDYIEGEKKRMRLKGKKKNKKKKNPYKRSR